MAITERALAPFEDVQTALEPYKPEKYHRLVPTALQERSPLFRPALAVVKVNPDDPREVYDTPGAKDGTVCLHTQTLEKIGGALGLDWIRTTYDRDPETPYMVTAHVDAEYIDAVGQRRRISASATTDLRDGSILAKISTPQQLNVSRQYINERTEARARNRIVRKVTGMPSSFRKEELAKPFVALRWRLDETDPDVKRAIIAQGVGATDMIFGRQAALPVGAPIDAGHENVGEVIEGQVSESEPEIPDDSTPKRDIATIQAAFQSLAKVGPREKVGDKDGKVAFALRDALGLMGKVDKNELTAVRRMMVAALMNVSVNDLTAGQARMIIERAADPDGQRDLRTVFAWVAEQDKDLAKIAAKTDPSAAAAAL